ncbi:type I-MYXAN CRISPR-associated protein Cas6/Cmx6 [Thioalkalivibrio halophilus]|uniref:Type I-MYXAN CRISPR-associated protein Cas6/Cmx6 n=1 Tax=Thioalkalivibrio halophilus TaxID=252474 RepID=A0A1V3A1C6_9GAMM|nr:type I-MYXAN CRISPR-associated protein Cas6/Cmx6 [Thioalkalivibrio halophilus]OOC11177.1 type I-MYXAN CRISPR-associated protein Cas6/Cmx6 [Thioalkalivibrio halophilus]
MFWDDTPATTPEQAEDTVDLAFRVHCPALPLDHAHALSQQICALLPWLQDEPRAGIHLIHGAESGNGWQRPEATIPLSRRTRLRLRLPRTRVEQAREIRGTRLDLGSAPLKIGEFTIVPLRAQPALMARHVIARPDQDEDAFLAEVAASLSAMGVPISKLLCGRSHQLQTPYGALFTRRLLVADLDPLASLRLQREGLGPERLMGCGLFDGHKDVAPVHSSPAMH